MTTIAVVLIVVVFVLALLYMTAMAAYHKGCLDELNKLDKAWKEFGENLALMHKSMENLDVVSKRLRYGIPPRHTIVEDN